MDEIWVVLEQEQGKLSDISWELVGQGRELAGRLKQRFCGIIMGSNIASVGEDLNHSGLDELYLVDSPHFVSYLPELFTQALSRLIQENVPQIVFCGATPNGNDLASRVAAKLRVGLISDCIGFDVDEEGQFLMEKPIHQGKALSTIASPHVRPQMATFRPGMFEVKDFHSAKKTEVTELSPEFNSDKHCLKLTGSIRIDTVTLPVDEADVVVAGGRGVGSGENFKMLEEAARALGGTLGASRVAIDNRWISRERQVGQSGKTVSAKLYIACGISGSSHHVLGMKDSQTVVAINTDPDAPIFKLADVGIVGDLLQVVPAITDEIARRREEQEKK